MKLSKHFHLAEFACHDGEDVPAEYLANLQALVTEVLQPVRDFWGRPLIVISGYRTPKYNKRVGGAKTSTHMTCEGADIRPVEIDQVPYLYSTILSMHQRGQLPGLGGIGVYKHWSHVDSRKAADGHLRRWYGVGVGSEPSD